MKKNTEPLQPDTYYHVYNRGINGARIFTKKGNADYFLAKFIKYIEPIANTYAYVLMGNHFHFLIKTKSETEILEFYENRNPTKTNAWGNVGRVLNPANVENPTNVLPKTASFIISKQFSNLFNTYAQAINKQDRRTGGLFEEPFRRIPIDSTDYLSYMVYYIHNNPVKHGFTDDFTTYLHSSYSIFLKNEPTFIQKNEVLSWFGGIERFLTYHGTLHDFDEGWHEKNWIEFD